MTNINDILVIYPSLEVSARVWTSCPLLLWFLAVWTPPSDTVGKSRALYLYSVLAGKRFQSANHWTAYLGSFENMRSTSSPKKSIIIISLVLANSLHAQAKWGDWWQWCGHRITWKLRILCIFLVQKRLIGWQFYRKKNILKAVASFLVCPDRIEL